ncbi:MAG: HIT domain-containing protein [Candidatus Taylorbacteria bacterium]|nr:HIT domain-containing protein [Candidatus Taylorbacteria bacterium]
MTETTTSNCIFCKIITKEIPAQIVYEDTDFIAFLDIRPISAGHTLIIPKHHHRWVWDVPNIDTYFIVVQKIAKALQKAFATESIHSKVVGEEIEHAHVWLYPSPDSSTLDAKAFEKNAELIKKALS